YYLNSRSMPPMAAKRLTVQQRREIFLALVTAQDAGVMSIAESKEHITKQYAITESQLGQIVDEGIEKEWPPLDEAAKAVGQPRGRAARPRGGGAKTLVLAPPLLFAPSPIAGRFFACTRRRDLAHSGCLDCQSERPGSPRGSCVPRGGRAM